MLFSICYLIRKNGFIYLLSVTWTPAKIETEIDSFDGFETKIHDTQNL